jgi:hypothetical protein
MYTIGTIIDSRADGSYIYMSQKGMLNLDDWKELEQEQLEDNCFLDSLSTSARSLRRSDVRRE